MFFGSLIAEFTKLRTTKTFWGNTIVFLVVSIGFAALNAYFTKSMASDTPGVALAAKTNAVFTVNFGGLVLAIMSILMITSEYSQRTISATFEATPKRYVVALAKLVLMGVIAAVYTFLSLVIGALIARGIAGGEMAQDLSLAGETMRPYLWKTPIYAFMFVLFAQGLAWVLRSAVASMFIILTWYMTVESFILPVIPKIGEKIAPYAPFKNLGAFYWGETIAETPWNYVGSLGYFSVWAVVLFAAGVALLHYRDA